MLIYMKLSEYLHNKLTKIQLAILYLINIYASLQQFGTFSNIRLINHCDNNNNNNIADDDEFITKLSLSHCYH